MFPPSLGDSSIAPGPLADTAGGARTHDDGEVSCPTDVEIPRVLPGQRGAYAVAPLGSTLVTTPGVSLGERAVGISGGTAAEGCDLVGKGAGPVEGGEQA